MAIYFSVKDIPAFTSVVLTIGTFDGVHSGHKVILEQVRSYAKEHGGESVLITFEPHPRKLIFPDKPIDIITPLDKKLQLITDAGIDHIVVVPFTAEFASLTASEYVADFLVGLFKPSAIVIGYDHRFGNDRQGDINLLKQLQKDYGYDVVEIPAQLIDDAAVSSTKVRNAIRLGEIEDAAHMLGRNYTLSGKVAKGAQLGRTIGYPTANIVPNHTEQIIPKNGVYAVRVTHKGDTYNAMLNVGYRPTVSSDNQLHVEAHIFNFKGDIYNEQLELEFVTRMRDEQKFGSIDALKAQLQQDEIKARSVLGIN